MNTKRVLLFASLIAFIISAVLFMFSRVDEKVKNKQPVVMVSTFALYETACAVAGNALEVKSIIPLGSDTHMFTPNPTQVADISKSALFVYNGAGFETWAQSLTTALGKTTQVIDMSQHVVLQKSDEHKEDHDEHGHKADHNDEHHDHGTYDPHYWLDIDNMIKMTQTLDTEFSKLSPPQAKIFHKNARAYIAQLQKLKSEYTAGLAECKNRTLVTNHDAFGYLAHANKLENISVIGLSSDEQPSAKNIAEIISAVKEHGVKTIFFEELINDNVSQTIAKETGAIAVPLQPLENISEDELKSHQTYLSIMRENLAKLRESMECR